MTTHFIGTDGLVYAPGNAQDVGKREDQQDSFGFSDPNDAGLMAHGGMLAIVADGMGGMAHGAEASQLAVRAFLQHYATKQIGEPITQALGRAVEAADRSVFEFADVGRSGARRRLDAGGGGLHTIGFVLDVSRRQCALSLP